MSKWTDHFKLKHLHDGSSSKVTQSKTTSFLQYLLFHKWGGNSLWPVNRLTGPLEKAENVGLPCRNMWKKPIISNALQGVGFKHFFYLPSSHVRSKKPPRLNKTYLNGKLLFLIHQTLSRVSITITEVVKILLFPVGSEGVTLIFCTSSEQDNNVHQNFWDILFVSECIKGTSSQGLWGLRILLPRCWSPAQCTQRPGSPSVLDQWVQLLFSCLQAQQNSQDEHAYQRNMQRTLTQPAT